MQLSHTRPVAASRFDDPNLVSTAGLVPVVALAERSGLLTLADEHLSVPTDKGSNAGRKIGSLVAGMVAGADSIADMTLLRHGAMKTLFDRPYAPSTLGSFLREFTFGHVRQLDAVASRFLCHLAEKTPIVDRADGRAMIDIDDSIIEVHGHSKQGSSYGYSGVRGLNSLITTLTTSTTAPVIVGQRLRRGSCGSSRGAARMIADTLTTVGRMRAAAAISATTSGNGDKSKSALKPLVRADSAFFGYPTIGAAIRGGADVSITTGLNSVIRSAISTIAGDAWTPIEYTHALFDEQTQRWISVAEVAEIPFTAFASQKKAHHVPGRLIVRRIPDLRPKKDQGQRQLFDVWRFHAFFTTTDPADLDTVAADKIHRRHAIIEQVHADLKNSALAHMPSAHFCANAAWLVCAVMAFNLTRAAATLTGDPALVKATTGTIRHKIISVPARIAYSARKLTLHLPTGWPWENPWITLFESMFRRNIPISA
ncbi:MULTISPECIES: IS1380 family transposase [Rhodococcus erythropolis group]|uniref:IS1380 family transposase n=1 Tax=Rhodococcus erythropolis TaxID=1833 RepID=A0A8I1A1G1_RHOER|nr:MULTISPECIES: IS1380 family transposase [Rhodococcus erythropolis group]MBH5144308.1 IS1380 family transposase [Rhodococcus erythropolis]MBH5144317.1 IS1380 family transposase [Rhodococcus erythropolis]MBH5144320.1 IS1380 family transposase [Rhodococcus erythropolis]MBH5145440.1 IS1380 family transposase [Rhodococcus erythropolis]MBH5146379.1 IS1380 family transposase [Rhodococcus erythropolis]